jgi:hypothetical protein
MVERRKQFLYKLLEALNIREWRFGLCLAAMKATQGSGACLKYRSGVCSR